MQFGSVSLDRAGGAILAHSLRGEGFAFRKGTRLDAEKIEALRAARIEQVTVALAGPADIDENAAAFAIGSAARDRAASNLRADPPFTGRSNLRAEANGVLRVDAAAVDAANRIDEALTLATLPDYERVAAGQLVGTAKVMTYFAEAASVERMADRLRGALVLHPFRAMRTHLIVTRTEGQKEALAAKGAEAIRARLASLGSDSVTLSAVAHDQAAVEDVLASDPAADLTLILGGSATSDRRDVAPAAVEAAGGRIERFGMPVDPGNLLALGRFRDAPLVILPGCARSPALNGADWVLERLAAGLDVTGADIAGMGVGGLLKEIPTRPQPREAEPDA